MKSREGHLSVGVYGARGIPSTYSGYETFLTTLLPELVDRGMNVTMYCRAEEGMGNSTWQGVRRSVLPSIGGKNTSTLSHGLVAAVASRRARHDVVLVVNVSKAVSRWFSIPMAKSGFVANGAERPGESFTARPRLQGAARQPSWRIAKQWQRCIEPSSVRTPQSFPTASRCRGGNRIPAW